MQTLDQVDLDIKKPIEFTPRELELFKEELDRQFAAGKGVNVFTALYSVRYMTMQEKSSKRKSKNKFLAFSDEEWKAYLEAQEIFWDSRPQDTSTEFKGIGKRK